MKKRIRTNGIIIFILVVTIAFFPGFFFRKGSGSPWDKIWEIGGLALILLGQTIRISARGYKSEHSQGGLVLIQEGPYALVRNPMYLGISFIGFGIVATLFKLWLIAAFLVIFLSRYLALIFLEEKRLSRAFPKEYAAFRKKTPRIIPGLDSLCKGDVSIYLPLKLHWLKREMPSIIPVLATVILLKLWKNVRNEGYTVLPAELAVVLTTLLLFTGLHIYLKKKTDGK